MMAIQIISPVGKPADNSVRLTIPPDATSRLDSIFIAMTTDATVGNRQIAIEYRHNGALLWRLMAPGLHAASQTQNYYFAIGVTQDAGPSVQREALPDVWLPPGGEFHVVTDSSEAGDAYVAIRALVRTV